MSRYIDADKIPYVISENGCLDDFAYRYDINEVPTADVVEVVRCKDCKHNPENGGECDRSITHTGRDYVCEVNTYRYIGIDYCSYGERREE